MCALLLLFLVATLVCGYFCCFCGWISVGFCVHFASTLLQLCAADRRPYIWRDFVYSWPELLLFSLLLSLLLRAVACNMLLANALLHLFEWYACWLSILSQFRSSYFCAAHSPASLLLFGSFYPKKKTMVALVLHFILSLFRVFTTRFCCCLFAVRRSPFAVRLWCFCFYYYFLLPFVVVQHRKRFFGDLWPL